MKRLQFAILLSIPLCWFFFKLLPVYTHPSDCSVANFIYAENFEHLKIWCFDANSTVRFDDSSNFLYVLSLWLLIHFFKFTTLKAAFAVSAFSMLMSVYLLQRIIDTRFWSVNLLLVGLLFMSTQIWAGTLGDEILFQGMLWLFAIRSFWKHRYFWLMIWCTLNIMARPDNIFIVLPLIIASYWDYAALKDRDKRKFIIRRIRRTFALFIFPTIGFFTYRYLYFGKVLPYNWLHHSLETDKQFGIFNFEAYNFLKHYLRYYTLPLVIGVAFYFLKERKKINIRYYALALSLLVIPMIYSCTFSQDENLAFKNYYPVYLGLIILSLLFIRDFRSITQGITTAIFVLFFGFKISFVYFQHTLQSYNNNEFYIANDLAQIHNGKAIVYYNTFIDWLTEWQTTYASGKHTIDGHKLTQDELASSLADVIITDNISDKKLLSEKYAFFSVPKNTRQYEKETKPENSLDQFFYKYSRKTPVNKNDNFTMLVWKFGNNYEDIKKVLENHGAKEISENKKISTNDKKLSHSFIGHRLYFCCCTT